MIRCRKCRQQVKRRSEACIYYKAVRRGPHYAMLMHNACVSEDDRRFVVDTRDFERLAKQFRIEILSYAGFIAPIAFYVHWKFDVRSDWVFIGAAAFFIIVSAMPFLNLMALNAMRRLPR